ncbi:hypothetical protein CENSYa_0171 [Cenarchaeum symbiosum A]|uniref:Uncharacterized protein n=1 Tax=Cenarchaeum symbiosum (strain A) TaxID=414004 RepID=A0RTZ9_CENSY|nr:hypothetical protein CENSYa_0171 [Cenarchaeum symbiosum A]
MLAGVVLYQAYLTRRDINIRHRAWIGRNSGEKLSLERYFIKMPISSYGPVPARDITITRYISENKGEKSFEKSDKEPFDMSPGETINLHLQISEDQYEKAVGSTIYFGWRIEYRTGNGSGVYEIDLRYKKGNNDVVTIKSR